MAEHKCRLNWVRVSAVTLLLEHSYCVFLNPDLDVQFM